MRDLVPFPGEFLESVERHRGPNEAFAGSRAGGLQYGTHEAPTSHPHSEHLGVDRHMRG